MKPRRIALAAATLAAFAASHAVATAEDPSSPPRPPARVESIRSVAEVIAVARTDRTLTLKRDDGNTISVHVGPKVKNFGQIGIGDFVVAEYGRAQALAIRKSGRETVSAPQRAPTAQAPIGMHLRSATADIIAIDDKKGFATAKGDHDRIIDLAVADRKLLATIRIGDRVDIDYYEAVVTTLRPARARRH